MFGGDDEVTSAITARALDNSSPTGADTNKISPSPRVPAVNASRPTSATRMGEMTELMTIAGTAENIPAANIHSASRREA